MIQDKYKERPVISNSTHKNIGAEERRGVFKNTQPPLTLNPNPPTQLVQPEVWSEAEVWEDARARARERAQE